MSTKFDFSSGSVTADPNPLGSMSSKYVWQVVDNHELKAEGNQGSWGVMDETAAFYPDASRLHGAVLLNGNWGAATTLRLTVDGGAQFDLVSLNILDQAMNPGTQFRFHTSAGADLYSGTLDGEGSATFAPGIAAVGITWVEISMLFGSDLFAPALDDIVLTNITYAPTFVAGSTAVSAVRNGAAVDLAPYLHVQDPDTAQTLTWTQATGPSHGTLAIAGATAGTGYGTLDVAPGGTLTYTPAAGFVGVDTLTVRVSDTIATATRTLTINVAPEQPGTPDLADASDTGGSTTDNVTAANTMTFTGTSGAGDTTSTVRVFFDANHNGAYDSGEATGTANVDNGTWTVTNVVTSGLASGTYDVRAVVTGGGVASAASTPLSVTVDHTAPTTTVSNIMLSDDTGVAGDLNTSQAAQTITATLSAPLAADETLYGSLDKGATWTALTGKVSGTALTWDDATLVANGGIRLRVEDEHHNAGTTAALAYTLDTLAPTTSVASAQLSADTGASAGDFVTKVQAQTIAGTLSAATVAGESVMVSFDGGAHAVQATNSVGSNTWTLAGQTLTGAFAMSVWVVDAAGNAGTVYNQAGIVDTDAPTATLPALTQLVYPAGTGFFVTVTYADGLSGVDADSVGVDDIAVTDAQGHALAVVGMARSGNAVTYTVTAPGGSFDAADAGTYTVGINANAVLDRAGNGIAANAAAGTVEVLFTTAPSVGALALSADTGTDGSDFVTRTASQTVTATLSKALAAGDQVWGSLDNGQSWMDITAMVSGTTVQWAGVTLSGSGTLVVRATDGNGNAGTVASHAYTLDTAAPTQSFDDVAIVYDTGPSGTDFITSVAQQNIGGVLNASRGPGEFVEVSFDDGATWTTTGGSGSTFGLIGVTLPASGILQVRVSDAAGNHGTPWTHAFVVDTTAPTAGTPVRPNLVDPTGGSFTFAITYADGTTAIDPATIGTGNVTVTGPGGALAVTGFAAAGNTVTYTVSAPGGAWDAADWGAYTIGINASVRDLAGNTVAANPSAHTFTVSPNLPPTATLALSGAVLRPGDTATLTVTFSEPVVGFSKADLHVPNGTLGTLSTQDNITFTATYTPDANIDAATNVITLELGWVADTMGLIGSGTASTPNFEVHTARPTATVAVDDTELTAGQSATVTIVFSAPVLGLDTGDLTAGSATVSHVTSSDGGVTWTATVTPAANAYVDGNTVRLDLSGVMNAAGNVGTGVVQSNAYAVHTGQPPVSEPQPTDTVDGVPVIASQQVDAATGRLINVIDVPVVTATGQDGRADIPLPASKEGQAAALVVGLPVGTGLGVNGPAALLTQIEALQDLVHRIEQMTGAGSAARAQMTGEGKDFLGSLQDTVLLQTATVTPISSGAGTIVISGTAGGAVAQGIVIDAHQLSGATTLQLDNVAFAAVVGHATLRGGAGNNIVIGDDASQNIYLGPGDDQLFGGGGDDVIGSAGGDDLLSGGAGNDALAGGIGNDTLDGGTGNDVLQGGRSDRGAWTFTLAADGTLSATHGTAMFAPGATETVARSELAAGVDALAFASASAAAVRDVALLYHAAFGRAPDLAGLNYYLGQGGTPPQVAQQFLSSSEWSAPADGSDAAFVQALYTRVLGRAGDADGIAWWTGQMAHGLSRAGVLLAFATSGEHGAHFADGIAVATANVTAEQGWFAGSGNDRLTGGAGNDVLVGGDGIDTAVFTGKQADYQLRVTANGIVVTGGADGSDTLSGIERAEFADGALDLSSATVGTLGLLYGAVLGRAADLPGLAAWTGHGLTAAQLADGFAQSGEFAARYGALADSAFVAALYANSALASSAAGGQAAWVDYLHTHTRAELVGAWIGQHDVASAQWGTAML